MGFQAPGPLSPWQWLLLLVALKGSKATSDLNEPTDSAAQQEPGAGFAVSGPALGEITVFALDYDYVQVPYEVTLWILLASLAKIGESLHLGCARLPHERLSVAAPGMGAEWVYCGAVTSALPSIPGGHQLRAAVGAQACVLACKVYLRCWVVWISRFGVTTM